MSKQHQENSPRTGRGIWLWVIAAFLVLIAAWTTLIVIAAKNQPEIIEIEQP